MPRFTRILEGLPDTVPFVGPEAQERSCGSRFQARIGANESVFGPSPHAKKAMADSLDGVWQYGDPENHDLVQALAGHYGIPFRNVMIGEGIDGLLGYLARMLVTEETRIVTSSGAYPTFNYHVIGYGGELITVPYSEDREDVRSLVNVANEVDAAMLYLANPDNPMGTWSSAREIDDAVSKLRDDCLFVLDEAYIEFAPEGLSPGIDIENKKIIRMRTFSKAFGMAGARVGYAIGHHEVIGAFNRIRNHFGMCRVSQAGALAALFDQGYLREVVDKVAQARERIYEIALSCGLRTVPSAANFVAIDCGGDGAFAAAVLNQLVSRGIFVRMPFVEPQNRCIRVSAGTTADLDLLERELPAALAAAGR